MSFTPSAVLFDLDGTVLDTAPDMARVLNQLLSERGRRVLPAATIRPVVSHGSLGLLQLGFGFGAEHAEFAELRQQFLDLYQNDLIGSGPALFAGMAVVLTALEQQGIPWGIVTNKPEYLTWPLLSLLALDTRSACVVGGDTVARAKPDPLPLLHACALLDVAPERCLYVGDAERDVVAGQRAGMTTVIARYGYIGAQDTPDAWGAHASIDHPQALLDLLIQP